MMQYLSKWLNEALCLPVNSLYCKQISKQDYKVSLISQEQRLSLQAEIELAIILSPKRTF